MRELTIRQALGEVSRQTNYDVVVNWDNLNPDKKVMMPANSLSVREVLAHTLNGTGYTWHLLNNQLAITRAKVDDGSNALSAMYREGLHSAQMKFVPDPWSKTQPPYEEVMRDYIESLNSYDSGKDSVGMVQINYRINSSTVIRDYMNNAEALEIIHKTFTNKDVLANLDYVVVTAGASPDGNTRFNEKLAADRAMAMKSYLLWKYPFLDRNMIYTFSVGEDWSGLRKMIYEDKNVPNRIEALDIIDSRLSVDLKRANLKALGGGVTYRYISKNILPNLRGASAVSLHYKPEPKPIVIVKERHTVDTVFVDRIVEKEVPFYVYPEYEMHPLFAVKTNLLYDAASALNVEIEIPIGRRWSIAGEYVFPWWVWDNKQIAMQTLNGTLETRYWFGDRYQRPQLTGWYMGLYGGGGYYDFEWKDKGYQGEFFHVGLGAGYAHTLGKSRHWRMEYSLGVGYMRTDYRKYVPMLGLDDEWHLIREKTGTYHWIGPTRAKVSLVFMINHGYREKGGAR